MFSELDDLQLTGGVLICSWGWNGDGQLGLGDLSNRTSPELVELGGESLISIAKASSSVHAFTNLSSLLHPAILHVIATTC